MSTQKLVMWITFLGLFAMAANFSMDTDTWWHLRAGQWILEQGEILSTDYFSYTRFGSDWRYPGWIIQVPLYVLHRSFGPGGLNLWTAVMVTGAFALIWPVLSGGAFLRAFVVVIAGAASGVYWAARPYMVTFVSVAVFLKFLEGYQQGRIRQLWALPVIMLFWVNSHGGYIIGVILWGVYLVDAVIDSGIFATRAVNTRTKYLFQTGVFLLLATLVNPSGPAIWAYPFQTLSIQALREFIQEWQTPDFQNIQMQPFLWLLFLCLGALGFSHLRVKWSHFLLLVVFAYLSFMASRNIALFALVCLPLLTRHANPIVTSVLQRLKIKIDDNSSSQSSGWHRVVNGLVLMVLMGAVFYRVMLIFPHELNWEHFHETLPVRAVEHISQEKPPGRLFNSYNWGGYLLWSLRDYPVFIDGRTDLYNDEIVNQWLQVVRGDLGWQQVLDQWKVNLVLIEPNMPLVEQLEGERWQISYKDEISVVYTRTE